MSEYGDLIIMQVAFEQYSSDYRCTIKIDSLMEGEQEKQGDLEFRIFRIVSRVFVTTVGNVAIWRISSLKTLCEFNTRQNLYCILFN